MPSRTVQEITDRRGVPRFSLPVGRVTGAKGKETLLNIGRRGMALETPIGDGFEQGQSHFFTLRDLNHSIKVRARVCWSRSERQDRVTIGGFESMQVAGFEFEEILTSRPEGIWRNLKAVRQLTSGEDGRASSKEVSGGSQASLITLIEPENGSTVALPSITVVCRLAEPSAVTSVSLNGIEATLEGELAKVDLELDQGRNPLRALVWQEGGTYRTRLLGSIRWREDR